MRLSVYEDGGRLYYRIEHPDAVYEKAILGLGYGKSGDGYIKSFPAVFPHREKIIANFLKNGEAVILEQAGLTPMKWREGFTHFASIAHARDIDWWTTGKILLPLNGVDTDIDDVDFYFHPFDLDAVYGAFSDYLIEPIVRETHRSTAFEYYGLAYAQCAICMLVGPRESLDSPEPVHFGQFASRNLVSVSWNGYTIKAPPIELYIKTLRRWGKTEFAQSIQDALALRA